jgi:hypothetical protein
MNREDIRKLLGGYAAGTLTAAEQEALLAAALEDQELFDALMKEEALRDVLQDPASKAELLAALDQAPARPAWWNWRPLIGAVAMAGLALGTVAVWRATREKPVSVLVADSVKQPAAASTEVVTAPPVRDVAIGPAPPAKPVARAKTRAQVQVAPESRRELDTAASNAPVSKDQAADKIMPAAPVPAAAPPPPPVQQAQNQVNLPAPMAQQQLSQSASSASVAAAEAMNRNAAVNSFRVTSGVKEISPALFAAKKAGPPLQWAILRGDRESPPDTVLDAGEAIRLRIVSLGPGVVTVSEGDKVLASGSVESLRPFDTPPIPFTVSGPRVLRVTLTMDKGEPIVVPIPLMYGK